MRRGAALRRRVDARGRPSEKLLSRRRVGRLYTRGLNPRAEKAANAVYSPRHAPPSRLLGKIRATRVESARCRAAQNRLKRGILRKESVKRHRFEARLPSVGIRAA